MEKLINMYTVEKEKKRAKWKSLNSRFFSQCYFEKLSKWFGKIGPDKRSPSFSQ